MIRPHRFAVLSALLLWQGATSHSQEVVWQREGIADVVKLGDRHAVIGDVNGDGWEEVLHLALIWSPVGRTTELWMLSGRDGLPLRTWPVWDQMWPWPEIARCGDMDGDGVPDYAVQIVWRTSTDTAVEVRSGVDDHLIWSVQRPRVEGFGYHVLGDLDLDGDHRPDLIVPAYAAMNYYGSVFAYKNDGTLLYRLDGNDLLSWGRSSAILGRAGDADGDGCDDFVLGAFEPLGRGAAILVSGRDGAFLQVGFGELPGDSIGFAVDGCGDLDLDGVPDFMGSSHGNLATRGIVRAFSGRTGEVLRQWVQHQPGSGFGFAIAGGLDLDRDGVPDVIASAENESTPWVGQASVYGFSGRDGRRLFRVSSPRANFGIWLEAVGTPPDHPFPTFVVSDPDHGTGGPLYGFNPGRIVMYRGVPGGIEPLGQGCTGTSNRTPVMGLGGMQSGGIRVSMHDAPAGAPAALLLGLSSTSFHGLPLPLALDPLGFLGCTLYTSADCVLSRSTGTSGLDAGFASFDVPFPLLGGGLGTFEIHGQWLVLDPSSLPGALSDALTWTYL